MNFSRTRLVFFESLNSEFPTFSILELTFAWLCDDLSARVRWFRLAGLVHGANTELVRLVGLETLDGRLALVSGNFEARFPITEFVLLLDNVFLNGSTTIVGGFLPFQVDMILIPIGCLEIFGLAWRIEGILCDDRFLGLEWL